MEMKVVKTDQVAKDKPLFPLFFTGEVKVQSLIAPSEGYILSANVVHFAKGVRTKWHTHTSDQMLYITEGEGVVATEKEEVKVKKGDVVLFPANIKHIHGASKTSAMSHFYVTPTDAKSAQTEE
jgi:quercetin dioxygenase-like cupin family protein